MNNKEQVIEKIKRLCFAKDIEIPDFDNHKVVLHTIDLINNTCPFCKKYVGHNTSVICRCEIKFND